MPKTTMAFLTFKPVYNKVLKFINEFENYSPTQKGKTFFDENFLEKFQDYQLTMPVFEAQSVVNSTTIAAFLKRPGNEKFKSDLLNTRDTNNRVTYEHRSMLRLNENGIEGRSYTSNIS